mmetsp:Transcript_9428/g.35297  ORF Transcript_9428/g.35297 Transcript_9428/m.35297 type:complete len:139 (-) Transcript_9428:83-499(-)|eukprot:scaffold3350_cov268-Pinguiococcus_pyrenoidosus.AAC.1
MALQHLFIINRSGGLMYHQDLQDEAPRISENDWLLLAGTFHGLHTIATQVAPLASSGIQTVESSSIVVCCFQTLTGIKFVVTAGAGTGGLDGFLHQIYQKYTDYVLKNPFYDMDQPIHCELFTRSVVNTIVAFPSSKR